MRGESRIMSCSNGRESHLQPRRSLLMQGWRTRLFHLSRNRGFLARMVASIFVTAILLSLALHHLSPADPAMLNPETGSEAMQIREGYQRLRLASESSPRALAEWLRDTASLDYDEIQFDAVKFTALGLDLHEVVNKHTGDSRLQQAMRDYAFATFSSDPATKLEARERLVLLTSQASAPALSHELIGDLHFAEKQQGQALRSYLQAASDDESVHARDMGLRLALRLDDIAAAKALGQNELVLKEADTIHLWAAAELTKDRKLLFHALFKMQTGRWMEPVTLLMALLAAMTWYGVLIYSAGSGSWRFLQYIPAVFAGIASVWLLLWWQGTLGYESDAENQPTMAQELFRWIMYVGVPEEAAKLFCFLPFLPWLLKCKGPREAALTAGCVGLGFALDENLYYLQENGFMVATGRLLTANFMHICLTGVLGWYAFDMVRSRFHKVTEFILAFLGVAAAHGVYDFTSGSSSIQWGLDIVGILILAFGARLYFQILAPDQVTSQRLIISRTAVFLAGVSLLTGLLMIVLVQESQSLIGITEVLKQSLALIPVALIYIHEFREG
jgi:protease PrsW